MWTVATVINGFEGGKKWLSQYLGIGSRLVPQWSFFAPEPGQHDFHLFYRDRYVDGSVSSWNEISDVTTARSPTDWIWNPYYYRAKIVFDVTQPLVVSLNDRTPDKIVTVDDEEVSAKEIEQVELGELQLSHRYLTLLDYVSSRDRSDLSTERQFMIMRHSRTTEYETLFVSHFHELP
ncbi:hypothetical protein [Haloterrigena salinisoli]|uniref:hypothetical protein n=1 Tax=Haloterrigena salinisoli TaxID=3132747 RepID=UPI0030D0221D